MSRDNSALKIIKKVTGRATSDGAGVNLTRIMGTPELNMLDPFLLLDEFQSDKADDYIAGFPDHPHRGFETVTYMLAGKIRHKDNAGHEGVIEPGGIQWMTAGRGIIHSEMPEQEDGLLWGFQLWINLPATQKMTEPRYQEFSKDEIPRETRDGNIIVRVITGETSLGTKGPVKNIATNPVYLDVRLPAGTEFSEPVATSNNKFVYVYSGSLSLPDTDNRITKLETGDLAVLGQGEKLCITVGTDGAKCLFLSALPLNEPVARGGPFVMNTRDEIEQAVRDYQEGNL
jgi:redox-sensitive bicupin YhaK (pirin superfamily)